MSTTTTHECPRCGDVHLPKVRPEGPFGPHMPHHKMLDGFDTMYGRWCTQCHAWIARPDSPETA